MPLLHYVELGDSTQQSIIIIHGLFGSHKNWGRISQQLSRHYHVIAVDCRNHGDSFNSTDMNYHVMADDIWRIVEELQLSKPIVMGHSMGGKIAMQLVAEHEESFSQLLVIDIAPVTYQHNFEELVLPVLELDITHLKSRKQADEILAVSIDNDFIRLFLLQSLARVNQYWYWKTDWQNILANMQEILAAPEIDSLLSIETLFVFGEHSEYYTQEGLDAVVNQFSNAAIEVIPKGNHWLHYDQADEFLARINHFLITDKKE